MCSKSEVVEQTKSADREKVAEFCPKMLKMDWDLWMAEIQNPKQDYTGL